jgi:hypothetical protein
MKANTSLSLIFSLLYLVLHAYAIAHDQIRKFCYRRWPFVADLHKIFSFIRVSRPNPDMSTMPFCRTRTPAPFMTDRSWT